MNNPIRLALATACLSAVFVVSASYAQTQQPPSPGYGMWQQLTPEQQKQMWENMQRGGYGPGMMGGYGYGPGYGMGPGMMGGYGPGWGMMGPGMMGGYGPSYGMGPGMMGGYGPGYGMGPGMMGNWAGLNLSQSQLEQWDKIHDKLQDKHRKLMSEMWDEQARLAKLYNADKLDSSAIGKSYEKLAKLQREAIEARIEAENKFYELLTKEQKAQVRRGYGWGMMGY